MTGDLPGDVLAHLHANPSLDPEQLAEILGVPLRTVDEVVAELVDAGHLERQGDRLVPDAASRAEPGLFVANERADAQTLETPLGDDEDPEE